MIILKSCPRCQGDMVLESLGHDDAELVCLQCSYRRSAPNDLEIKPAGRHSTQHRTPPALAAASGR